MKTDKKNAIDPITAIKKTSQWQAKNSSANENYTEIVFFSIQELNKINTGNICNFD